METRGYSARHLRASQRWRLARITGVAAVSVAAIAIPLLPTGASGSAALLPECSFSVNAVRVVVNGGGRGPVLFTNNGTKNARVLLTHNPRHTDLVGRQHVIAPGETFGFGPSAVFTTQTDPPQTLLSGLLFVAVAPFVEGDRGIPITDRVNACLNGSGIALPESGFSGGQVTFTSGGFTAGERVDVRLAGSPNVVASDLANSTGTFAAETTLPALPGGSHEFVANGETSAYTVAMTYTVLPLLTFTPWIADTGTRVTATLSGFGAGAAVPLRKVVATAGQLSGPVLKTVTMDATGSGTTEVRVTGASGDNFTVCAVQRQHNGQWACSAVTIS